MPDYLIKELEKYREAAMLYWHVVGDDDCAEDLGTKTHEDLLLQAVIMARVKMQIDTKEYKQFEKEK